MSGMPDLEKTYMGCKLDTELVALARHEARIRKMTLTDFLEYVLKKELEFSKTQLDESDIAWIKEQLEKNIKTRNSRRLG